MKISFIIYILITVLLYIFFVCNSYTAEPDSTRGERERPSTTTTRTPKSSKDKEDKVSEGSWIIRILVAIFTNDDDSDTIRMERVREKEKTHYRIILPQTRGYTGISLGGVSPIGFIAEDYDAGVEIAVRNGISLPAGFGVDVLLRYTGFGGYPNYDYVTTTRYPNGDVRKIESIPVNASLSLFTIGSLVHQTWYYHNIQNNSITGLRLAAGVNYTIYRERANLFQDIYINEKLISSSSGQSSGTISVPSFRVEVGGNYSYSDHSRWRFEAVLGYEHALHKPSFRKPLTLDWNDFLGQIGFSIGFKYRIF